MFIETASGSVEESLTGTMQVLAAYITANLNEVQNDNELTDLLNHADSEIRQEASHIYQEISQLKAKLGQL